MFIWISVDDQHRAADPLEMSYLLGIAGGCLTAFLLLVCLCIYAVRARKCCFKGKVASSLDFTTPTPTHTAHSSNRKRIKKKP